MKTTIKVDIDRLRCWWLGCEPHPQDPAPPDYVHCMHCGELISFHSMMSGSRHEKFKLCLKYYFFKKWVPDKCVDCGKRYGDHSQCIPF